MIALRSSVAASSASRAAARAQPAAKHGSISRPVSVCVRAFKDDATAAAAKQQASSSANNNKQQLAKHQPSPAAARMPSVFQQMQREMDAMSRAFGLSMPSLFDDDLFLRPTPSMLTTTRLELPALPTMRVAVDVEETDKEYIIKADTPGIPKESLKLRVLDGTLTISGERTEEKQEGGEEQQQAEEGATDDAANASTAVTTATTTSAKTPVRYERSYGSFSRSFSLPPNVDVEGISAEAKDGVLTVRIPKVPEQKPQPQEIPVN